MGVLAERSQKRAEAYESYAQEKRKQDEQIRANMRRLKELRTNVTAEEPPAK
jgi:hypothetical protein